MNAQRFAFIFFIGAIFFSCNQNPDKVSIEKASTEQSIVADTIIYDVLIKNPDPLDEWTNQCLSKLNKSYLVDQIFDAVYDEKLVAYDFFQESILSIDNIKDLEKLDDFDRSKVARVQFEELWLYDEENLRMTKKVYSIMLAYEIYGNTGEIKGYKPAFKVYFNK